MRTQILEMGLPCRLHCRSPLRIPFVSVPGCGPRSVPRGARASGKEEAVASMQAYKAGLAKALASRGESLRAEVGAKPAALVGERASSSGLRELNADDFYPFIEESNGAGKLVLVDFYTDWCGPCKLMLPMLEEMAVELEGKAEIVKFNCNKQNKELGQSLGIKVAPTFHLYRDNKQVAMMTGAKIDELKELVSKHL